MDRQMDGQKDVIAILISCISILTRDKNRDFQLISCFWVDAVIICSVFSVQCCQQF